MEAAAYFVVAEALTNTARHSGTGRAEIQITPTATGLRVMIRDDGKGGAKEAAAGLEPGGSGLPGMRRRVAALDGTFSVTSPQGGPTIIEAELPCAW